MTKFFKKYIPSQDFIRKHPNLKFLSKFLDKDELWNFSSKYSVATGIAIGCFAAFIIPIGQFALAGILAVALRGNLPLALAGTLITNPLTFGPWNYLAYSIGNSVLALFNYKSEPFKTITLSISNILDMGTAWITGIGILSITTPIVAYCAVIFFWDFFHKNQLE